MWTRIKNISVVVVITMLIWLVADQYVREEQSFRVPVRVVSPTPDRYTAIAGPPYQITLNVTMAGPRKHLRRFNDLLQSKAFFEAAIDETMIDETRVSSAIPHSISALDDILRKIKEIKEWHRSIKRVSPRTVSVRIDHFEDIPNVAVEPDYGDLRVVNPSCKPDKVSVRLPSFARRQLLSERVIRPKVESVIRDATTETETDYQLPLTVSLDADPALGVEITPSEVVLSGVVEALNATVTKGPVQITFSIPDEVQERFTVVAVAGTNFRQNIDVTGPKELLDQLDPRDIRAFVDVMAADMDELDREITRPVQYVLPPGFAQPRDTPPHEITFRLVPRSVATTPNN